MLEQLETTPEGERGDLLKNLVIELAEMPQEQRAETIRNWVLSLSPLDLALLIQIGAGLVHREDLEEDYIISRVREWLDLKIKKEL